MPSRVLAAFGTRPEAVKLCVLVRRLQKHPETFLVRTCVTGQHRSMLDQALEAFGVRPDYDLNVMTARQPLAGLTARILERIEPVLANERPDLVLVQGDTATTFAAALAAFYARVPVAHVEAGLRTGDKFSPYPEEMSRRLTARLADLHFAPTEGAARNLLREGADPARVHVTGNTVVDAARWIASRMDREAARPPWPFLDPAKKLLLVTAHRRESFGPALRSICKAVRRLARRADVQVVFPVHCNPRVREAVHEELRGAASVALIEPLSYPEFIGLLRRCCLVLTDSGGILEEAPAFGKPVLVLRENTERREAIEAGAARLAGCSAERIVAEAGRLLDSGEAYRRMACARNPFGDGRACERIAGILAAFLDKPRTSGRGFLAAGA